MEIAERCELRGIAPVFVYLPPPLAVQAARFRRELDALTLALDLSAEEVSISNLMATEMIDAVELAGHGVLDLRDAFRASGEPLYWNSDFHINTAGHRLAAELIAAKVEEACPAPSARGSAADQPK